MTDDWGGGGGGSLNWKMSEEFMTSLLEDNSSPEEVLLLLGEYNDDDPQVLLCLARKCQEHSLFKEAETLCHKALEKEPNNPVIKDCQRTLFHQMVDRWHFLMLNDIQRNSSYFKAILAAVRALSSSSSSSLTCSVVDIGAGTGILR